MYTTLRDSTPRKGVRLLLDTLQNADTDPNTHILLVGRQAPDVTQMLAEAKLRQYREQGAFMS